MVSSTPGIIISAAGTLLLLVLFVFQLKDYLAIGSETTLVVDELVDDTLRVNFNVTLHEVRRPLDPPRQLTWSRCAYRLTGPPAQLSGLPTVLAGAVRVPRGRCLRPNGHRAA